MQKRYILLDANVAAAAFAPSTTRSANLVARSRILLTGSARGYQAQFLIPNFCIGETFAVFEKYRWGGAWNSHVSPTTRLTPAKFAAARRAFHDAIHNGNKMLQIALDRYHVLCLDLIAPINAAYRIKRDRGQKKNVSPASTYDLLVLAMGIWLQKQFGSDDFVIATGDERLALVAKRARSVALAQPMKAHLTDVAKGVGLAYGPGVYPDVVDLIRSDRARLHQAFPDWNPSW